VVIHQCHSFYRTTKGTRRVISCWKMMGEGVGVAGVIASGKEVQ